MINAGDRVPVMEINLAVDASPSFKLGREVHAWLIDVPAGTGVPGAWLAALSPEERTRAGRFVFARDRKLYEASHAALRQVVGRYMDTDPASIRYGSAEGGKPFIEAPGPSLSFNLSHSGDKALISLSEQETGADIEVVRPGRNLDAVAQRYFTSGERSRMASAPDPVSFFYRIWAGKEAVLKARGTGLFTRMPETAASDGHEGEDHACYFRPDAGSYACVYPVRKEKPFRVFRMENFVQFERSFPLSATPRR